MNSAPPDISTTKPDGSDSRQWLGVTALMVAMNAMRVIYACMIDLRTDEAYYWTWSKENVLSFLDHPPMISWFIRAGTLIFGDALINMGSNGFSFLPNKYCFNPKLMRRSLRKVLDYPCERILFAHGTPILSQAKSRLTNLLRDS